jgi:uncharacterized protein (DUF305 family)
MTRLPIFKKDTLYRMSLIRLCFWMSLLICHLRNNMKNISLHNNYSLSLLSLLFAVQTTVAQLTPHNHQMPPQSKNIFLVMMDSMMIKMDAASSGESFRASFILKIIPLHEGAVEMANYEIQYGKYFTMIQLAKSILIEQKYEIQQMRLWLKESPSDTVNLTATFNENMNQTMATMMQHMPANNTLNNADRAFAKVMIPHHQAAVDMAKVAIRFTKDQQTNSFAKHIISSQQIEIEQMSSFLKQ